MSTLRGGKCEKAELMASLTKDLSLPDRIVEQLKIASPLNWFISLLLLFSFVGVISCFDFGFWILYLDLDLNSGLTWFGFWYWFWFWVGFRFDFSLQFGFGFGMSERKFFFQKHWGGKIREKIVSSIKEIVRWLKEELLDREVKAHMQSELVHWKNTSSTYGEKVGFVWTSKWYYRVNTHYVS